MSADLWKLLHWERESVKPPEHYTAEQQYGWRQAMAQGRTILSDYQQHGIGKEAFALLPAASPEGRGASCSDYAPAGYTGHWREWHRGHGCNLDDTAAKAEGRGAPTKEQEAMELYDAVANWPAVVKRANGQRSLVESLSLLIEDLDSERVKAVKRAEGRGAAPQEKPWHADNTFHNPDNCCCPTCNPKPREDR